MLNKVMIIGRLGRDPELRYAANGTPMTTLNIATDESYTTREGEKKEHTEWHRVVVFQRQAENCANYLAKGSLVFVEGSLQTRKWQDQQGQDRYSTETRATRVQFLDRKGSLEGAGYAERGERTGFHDEDAPARNAPQKDARSQQNRRQQDEDPGPAFPSEVSGMDDVPF